MKDIHPPPSSGEESGLGTGIESGTKIQSLNERSRRDGRLNTLRILLEKRRGREGIMKKTETSESPSENFGPSSTENGSEKPVVSGTRVRSLDFRPRIEGSPMEQKSNSGSEPSIRNPPSEVLEPNSSSTLPTSEIIASESMSLLDESANHMFDLMKGLHANQPAAEVKSYDPDRVNAAVACANTIYKIMRLKLDAIKVQRKLK